MTPYDRDYEEELDSGSGESRHERLLNVLDMTATIGGIDLSEFDKKSITMFGLDKGNTPGINAIPSDLPDDVIDSILITIYMNNYVADDGIEEDNAKMYKKSLKASCGKWHTFYKCIVIFFYRKCSASTGGKWPCFNLVGVWRGL